MQTITQIYSKCLPLVGKVHTLPVTKNKGSPGLLLEQLVGIPPTSNCLDCLDGELKVFPVKQLKNGLFVPKESIAVTMLSTEELRTNDFASSKCFKKMNRMLVVPYFRSGETIRYMTPVLLDSALPEFKSVYSIFEEDYTTIRSQYVESGVLESKTGVFLQTRTKGPGHGSLSRAFYLRPECIKQLVSLN